MAYDLHIRRARGRDISLGEWEAYVERAVDLVPQPFSEATNPVTGDVLSIQSPGMARWTGHPEGLPVGFEFRGGEIAHGQPDEPTLARMQEIAAELDARIQGDEGEFYDAPKASGRS
jgi:hypothetical protein